MAISPTPTEIKLHLKSKFLEILFDNNKKCMLSAEFLRVHSPSAEVQGHSPEQAILQIGKENISIINIKAVGNYGIKIFFSDSHNTGIFSWSYLYKLAENYEIMWFDYIDKLKAAGYERIENEN